MSLEKPSYLNEIDSVPKYALDYEAFKKEGLKT
jgi:hypothetical protein